MEANGSIVCDACAVENLSNPIFLARCTECSSIYCSHNTSENDPQYCRDCVKDVQIVRREGRDKTKLVSYSGADWLFTARKIHNMNDLQLETAIEYHWAILNTMLAERSDRQREAFRKSVIKIANFKPSAQPLDMSGMPVPKVKKIKVAKDPSDVAKKMIADLMKNGFTLDMLKALAKDKQAKEPI